MEYNQFYYLFLKEYTVDFYHTNNLISPNSSLKYVKIITKVNLLVKLAEFVAANEYDI